MPVSLKCHTTSPTSQFSSYFDTFCKGPQPQSTFPISFGGVLVSFQYSSFLCKLLLTTSCLKCFNPDDIFEAERCLYKQFYIIPVLGIQTGPEPKFRKSWLDWLTQFLMIIDVTCCLDQSAKSRYLSLLPITAHSEQGHSNETSRTGCIKKKKNLCIRLKNPISLK